MSIAIFISYCYLPVHLKMSGFKTIILFFLTCPCIRGVVLLTWSNLAQSLQGQPVGLEGTLQGPFFLQASPGFVSSLFRQRTATFSCSKPVQRSVQIQEIEDRCKVTAKCVGTWMGKESAILLIYPHHQRPTWQLYFNIKCNSLSENIIKSIWLRPKK